MVSQKPFNFSLLDVNSISERTAEILKGEVLKLLRARGSYHSPQEASTCYDAGTLQLLDCNC